MANGLRQDLTERHISMIALSAQYGFGITIRSGTMLKLAGPGGALIIYAVSCFLSWALFGPFVEMSSVIPVVGPVWELPALLIDTTLGGTLGYMFLFMYLTVYAQEISVTTRLFRFAYKTGLSWDSIKGVSPAIWAAGTLVTSSVVNMLPVKVYGELEYWFGYLKMVGLIVIIVAQVPINLHGKAPGVINGGASTGRTGDIYWQGCRDANCTGSTGFIARTFRIGSGKHLYENSEPVARLMAIWTGVTYTTFSFISGTTISIAAAEARHRGQDLKSANRKTLLRLICLYMSGIFLVAFNVPYDHDHLLRFNDSDMQLSGSSSPFIIAMAEAGFLRLAHAANAYFIFATWSCATSNMYSASRILYSLALNGYMPEFKNIRRKLATTTGRGVPLNSIFACSFFGLLAFLNIGGKPRAQEALDALSRIGTMFFIIAFLGFSVIFIRYYNYLEARTQAGDPRPKVDREFGVKEARQDLASGETDAIDPSPLADPERTLPPTSEGNSKTNEGMDIEDARTLASSTNSITNRRIGARFKAWLEALLRRLHLLPEKSAGGIRVEIYAYKSHFQPWRSWFCILATSLFIVFNGWWVFVGRGSRFQWPDFVSCYISNLVFLLAWGGVKIWNRAVKGKPLALQPDKARLVSDTFLTAKVKIAQKPKGVREKIWKFVTTIWWWTY